MDICKWAWRAVFLASLSGLGACDIDQGSQVPRSQSQGADAVEDEDERRNRGRSGSNSTSPRGSTSGDRDSDEPRDRQDRGDRNSGNTSTTDSDRDNDDSDDPNERDDIEIDRDDESDEPRDLDDNPDDPADGQDDPQEDPPADPEPVQPAGIRAWSWPTPCPENFAPYVIVYGPSNGLYLPVARGACIDRTTCDAIPLTDGWQHVWQVVDGRAYCTSGPSDPAGAGGKMVGGVGPGPACADAGGIPGTSVAPEARAFELHVYQCGGLPFIAATAP